MDEIELNGIAYVRADSVPQPETSGRVAAIIDRGWVVIGDLERLQDGTVRLHRPVNLVRWGSGHLGGALSAPAVHDVVTCALPGPCDIPPTALLFTLPVADGWGLS